MSAKKSPAKKAARTRNSRRQTAPKKRGIISTILLVPFRAIAAFTSSWSPALKWTGRLALSLAFIGAIIFLLVGTFYGARSYSPRYNMNKVTEMPARSIVYARDGKTKIGTVHGDNRLIVNLDQVSPWFKKALLAREDARFYNHGAIDIRSMGRAVQRFFTHGKKEGASTITMQLADNSYGYKGKTIDGKLLEIAIAHRIEANYSKDEILEHYMNRIFWGHSIRGVESASRTYFEKPAERLTLSESALLAGIIRGPNIYSPFKNLKAALAQRDTTLDRMVKYEFITEAEADKAKAEKLHIRPEGRRIIHDTYAMDAIRRDLEKILEEQDIEMGGLHITTTIDAELQYSAEQSVEKRLRAIERRPGYNHQTRSKFRSLPKATRGAPKYIQGAVVAIDNHTGGVLAIVGGRNADESAYNRALFAKRQIGSVFKPFVYMTAFNKGLQPGSWVKDGRIRPGEIAGAPRNWSPRNSDGTYKSLMMVSEALARSRNTSSVRIGNYAGLHNVIDTAKSVGFEPERIPESPAIYLGAFESSPWEVAKAYTVFPNGGTVYRPFIISQITDSDGNVVYKGAGIIPWSAAKNGAAWSVSNTLQKVTSTGTASALRTTHNFKAPSAGKTGTTDNYHDAWFAGYTSSITCAVWVGMDDNTKTIDRGYGSTLALPIWADVMKSTLNAGYPARELKPSANMRTIRICRETSQLATQGCEASNTAYNASIPSDLIPSHTCDNHPVRAQVVDPNQPQPTPPRAVPIGE